MRVIAGSAKGMKLKAPGGLTVRPTADRVKEALFNIIGPRIINARFIDLYAGSGAIGIEALSRGAHSCIFIEKQRKNLILIKENLLKTGLEENARLIMTEVDKALLILNGEEIKADLVYLDPPYNCPDLDSVVKSVLELQIIVKNGLLIVEHAYKNRQWAEAYTLARQKKYGDTCLTIIPIT